MSNLPCGQSEATIEKQAIFKKLVTQELSIIRNRYAKKNTIPSYTYIDLNAGQGFYRIKKEIVEGSPVIVHSLVNKLFKVLEIRDKFVFVDKNKGVLKTLESFFIEELKTDDINFIDKNNVEFINEDFLPSLKKGQFDNYGLIYQDGNGKTNFEIYNKISKYKALYYFDLIINCSSYLKRAEKIPNITDTMLIKDGIKQIKKDYIYVSEIRNTSDKTDWCTIFATNYEKFIPDTKVFHNVLSNRGQEIIEEMSAFKKIITPVKRIEKTSDKINNIVLQNITIAKTLAVIAESLISNKNSIEELKQQRESDSDDIADIFGDIEKSSKAIKQQNTLIIDMLSKFKKSDINMVQVLVQIQTLIDVSISPLVTEIASLKAIVENPISNNEELVCPVGAKFGIDFDEYQRCDDCDIRQDCEAANAPEEPEPEVVDNIQSLNEQKAMDDRIEYYPIVCEKVPSDICIDSEYWLIRIEYGIHVYAYKRFDKVHSINIGLSTSFNLIESIKKIKAYKQKHNLVTNNRKE